MPDSTQQHKTAEPRQTITLRVPVDLWLEWKQEAQKAGQSLNCYLIERLEKENGK